MDCTLKDVDKGVQIGRDGNIVVTGRNGESHVTKARLAEEGGITRRWGGPLDLNMQEWVGSKERVWASVCEGVGCFLSKSREDR